MLDYLRGIFAQPWLLPGVGDPNFSLLKACSCGAMINAVFQFGLFQPLVQTPEVQPLSQFSGGTCHSGICPVMIVLAVLPHQFFFWVRYSLSIFSLGATFLFLIDLCCFIWLWCSLVLGLPPFASECCTWGLAVWGDSLSLYKWFDLLLQPVYLTITICCATVRTTLYIVTVSLVIHPNLYTFFHTVLPSLQDFLLPYAQLSSAHYRTHFLFLTLPGPSHSFLGIWLTELCQSRPWHYKPILYMDTSCLLLDPLHW